MPPPGRRPTAYEVSFGESQVDGPGWTEGAEFGSRPGSSLKRKSETREFEDGGREFKRRPPPPLPPVDYYAEQNNYVQETRDLVVFGEDPLDNNPQDKPVRVLTDFTFFDPCHENELISLAWIEEDDGKDRQFEGAGAVLPYFVNEEDEGQEEDDDAVTPTMVRLGAILRYTFDVTADNDPVYIETTLAWYVLRTPSKQYESYFKLFFTPRRIAQMVVSTALKHGQKQYVDFLRQFEETVDPFGRTYKKEDLLDAVPEIHASIEDLEGSDERKARSCPLIRKVLVLDPAPSKPKRRINAPSPRCNGPPIKSLLGDLDLAVLKPENQTPTHVTPLIAELARDLVNEDLVVMGAPPPPIDKAAIEAKRYAAHVRLKKLIQRAKSRAKIPKVDHGKDYWGRGSRYLKSVHINNEVYKAGDFIIVPIGTIEGRVRPGGVPGFPDDLNDVKLAHTLADYFWFARIIYGDIDRRMFHVQWLEHGSETMLEQLAHPQELFYHQDWCDSIRFETVVAKIQVFEQTTPPANSEHFFVKFNYNKTLATFTSIDLESRGVLACIDPPNNCGICAASSHDRQEEYPRLIKEAGGAEGIAYRGERYHLSDYVLYRSESGPAHIGYIQDITVQNKRSTEVTGVVLQRVGRVSDIPDDVLPPEHDDEFLDTRILRDERHLYLTYEEVNITDLDTLIRVVFVISTEEVDEDELDFWLQLSPDHFYAQYRFPKLQIRNWDSRQQVDKGNLPVCEACVEKCLEMYQEMEEFMNYMERRPLPTVDLFGGVAAFSTGLARGSGCLRVTDSVEKSPSAAMTTKKNFPDINVHNQCANVMVRYSVKNKQGHHPEVPKQIYDENLDVPRPINSAKCLVAGFPCQSHSGLNMYKKADDVKSNLILNALSWVDHLRPDICYFENVPGFLQFAFDAVQAGIHRTEGGTEMGGLKFLVRTLIDLKYQVRFGLLQAAHYGTPQRRSRFFLIAAVDGHPLPELPQPSHDFPDVKGLSIKLPIDPARPIQPIRASNGTAPHRVVTIENAIDDLPRFDWKHPKLDSLSREKRREFQARATEIPAFPCKDESSSAKSGYQGANFEYHHKKPKTSYQATARREATKNIQHYTRCFNSRKVERVIAIPMQAAADYRSLPTELQQWQLFHPESSVGRSNYRPGLYGRLNQKEWFPTTVTNMEPTAKQSRVLHPLCKRMVTVRELARSQGFPDHFVFEARNNNVVTMHRQIGNAVPLPVGIALGRELRMALFKKWKRDTSAATMVE